MNTTTMKGIFNINNRHIFLLFGLLLTAGLSLTGQVVTNDGAALYLSPGPTAIIYVDGDVLNQNGGTLDNSGQIYVNGDWENNATNNVFINSSPGEVILSGTNQIIRGSSATRFYDLNLDGPGIKSLQGVDTYVEGILDLDSAEFAADTHTVFVENPATGAVTRAVGFVSALGNGGLSRETNSTGTYSFPTGSTTGTPRYRPVDLQPASSSATTYKVRMANVDATTEGYNINNADPALCQVNDLFYHRISRTSGTTAANVIIWFDSLADDSFDGLAHWQGAPRWENTGTVSTSYNPSPLLSSITLNGWTNFSPDPFALATLNPNVSLSSTTDTICQGGSITYTANSGLSGYDFYNGSTLLQSGSNNAITLSGLSNGDTIRVVGVNSRGCTAEAIRTVVVNSLPAVSFSGLGTAYCVNDGAVSLSGSPSGGSFSGTGVSGTSFDPGAAGAGGYSVVYTYTDGNGCINADTQAVTVNGLPSVSFSGLANAYCNNDAAVTLTGSPSGGTFSGTGISGSSFDPAAAGAGTYSIVYDYTDGNGCTNTDSATTVVNAAPTPVITSSATGAVCDGDTVILDGGSASSWNWSPGGQTSQTIQVTTAGTYGVTVTDANNCSGEDTVSVTFQPQPAAAFTFNSSQTPLISFTDQSTGAPTSWSWDFGDGATSTQQNPQHTYTSNGTYTVTLVISNACGNDTITDVFTITSVGVSLFTSQNIQVFPNPNNGEFEILIEGLNGEELKVEIYSQNGQMVHFTPMERISGTYRTGFNLSQFAKGAYLIKVNIGNRLFTKNVVTR